VLLAQGGTRLRGGGPPAATQLQEGMGRSQAAQARAAANQVRLLGAAAQAETIHSEVLTEALRAYGETLAAGVEILAEVKERQEAVAAHARSLEAEALSDGPRHEASSLEALRQQMPAADRPPSSAGADEELWRDYVAYWEARLAEMADEVPRPKGLPAPKPPLKWSSYQKFQGRFQRARSFQGNVSSTFWREASLPVEERIWLRGLRDPLVTENMGLWHEDSKTLTFADQYVVDRATLGGEGKPLVLTFSNKQRDFSSMSERQVRSQVEEDIDEALEKYGGTLEVRRPGHPLFGRKVTVSKVYLVYDETTLTQELRDLVRNTAEGRGVEVRFHAR
jgi:hypothetical protein